MRLLDLTWGTIDTRDIAKARQVEGYSEGIVDVLPAGSSGDYPTSDP